MTALRRKAGRGATAGPAAGLAGVEQTHLGRLLVYAFVAGVTTTGALVLVLGLMFGPPPQLATLLLFCAGAGGAEWFKVRIENDSPVAASLALSVIVAAMVTLGPGGAALCGLSAVLVPAVLRAPRPALRKVLFNSGMFSLCATVGALVFALMGGQIAGPIRGWDLLAALFGGVAYVGVNMILLGTIVRLTTGRSLRQIWSEDMQWIAVQLISGAAIGFALGAAFRILGLLGAAAYLAPMFAIRESMRLYTTRVHRSNEELTAANHALDVTNEGLLKTLAAVIDARDVFLYGHSLQASKYAAEVARKLGVAAEEVRTCELGALLHDIGKIGIRDSILNKPGPLTPEEYEAIKAHAQIGYELLSNLPGFEAVADVVRAHHERWDGGGYPLGLAGSQIPVGARIVSVVEAVEAMVSDRPYRRGMTPEQVLEELARGAGTQWDAAVVEVFAEILSKDHKHLVMRNSALEIALNRSPLGELLGRANGVVADPALRDLTATFASAAQPIFILDNDYRIVSINPTAERLTGYSAGAVEGWEWAELCAARELHHAIPQTFFGSTRQVSLISASGTAVELEVTGTPLRTSSSTYWLVLAHDVSHRVQAERALKREARTDFLTKLATRGDFEERAVHAMLRGMRPLTLAMLDLDELKAVNDTHGHLAGDELLRLFGQVLAGQVREGDVAARYGGDEFVVLLPGSDARAAERMVERVAEALRDREVAPGVLVRFSTGIAEWDGAEMLAELIARADAELYQEKESRRSLVVTLPPRRAVAGG
jgi:diguanylate cyclase (GGDEF)-like protein/PAS domain S-box-containing protein/putative nucleotidyltransferase with HDIG domain